MRIKYVGVKGVMKSTGCSKCGRRMKVKNSVQYSKRMQLPTGRSLNFVIGQTLEVTDTEGEFLKNWSYPNGNFSEYPFVEVE